MRAKRDLFGGPSFALLLATVYHASMQRNMARIKVSTELVVKALHFPEGTEIVSALVVRDTHGPIIVIAVEHEDLPPVDEGDVLPEIMPIVRYRRESWDFNWNAQVEHEMVYDDMDEGEIPHPAERADEDEID